MKVLVDTEDRDQMYNIAPAAYKFRSKVRDWSIDNPDGPSGTPVQRNVERLKRALKVGLEKHGKQRASVVVVDEVGNTVLDATEGFTGDFKV